MCAVALIYFARLSVEALSHVQERPAGFASYKMPRWWGLYRNLGERPPVLGGAVLG